MRELSLLARPGQDERLDALARAVLGRLIETLLGSRREYTDVR
jgi:hypothetical protein